MYMSEILLYNWWENQMCVFNVWRTSDRLRKIRPYVFKNGDAWKTGRIAADDATV